ncbi:MAG: GNAT family N-acetyltransferase [Actinomycetota bacterium]|nr:GNAT family N-acetyltransferase [Actinomycetota bacterium]
MTVGSGSPAGATGASAGFILLADGTSARIREATSADVAEIADLHAQASDQSIYRRFSASRTTVDAFVDLICHPTPSSWSLVAVRAGHLIGVATASAGGGHNTDEAEVAFLVDETSHGVGIGTVLLERLARDARRRGISKFVAEVLTENVPMLRVFHDVGFELDEQQDHGVVALTMDLRVSPGSIAANDARQRQAQRRSLSALFEPNSVAVLGVGRRRGGIGREVVENILEGGYAGQVLAVGRAGLSIPGVTSLRDIDDLPKGVDLVVVALPASRLEDAVRAAAGRGTRCCVVLSAGLGETGEAGAALERRVAEVARAHDMRLVGPNCFGVLSQLRGTRLDATFGTFRPSPGLLAVGSQSGGVGVALLQAARARRTGVGCFVSLGNKADVSGNDLLAAWTDDPDIAAAALYLESFHDPRTFARLAATFSRAKPLLVVFGGSSAAGTRAGASHTAANATPARALQALFRAAGVVDVESIDDLVDTAALLTEQPLPGGTRLGILGNAGGLGIIAADAAQRTGLDVPELSRRTRDRMRPAAPGLAGTSNPVDLGAAASADGFGAAAHILLNSGEVDSLLVVVAATAVTDLDAIAAAVERTAALSPDVPCLSVMTGASGPPPLRTTRFGSSEAAVRALAHAVRYAAWRRTAAARPAPSPDDAAASPTGQLRWLDTAESERLLTPVGVRCVPSFEARTDHDVMAALRRIHYPVVVKTGIPEVVHKSEDRLVRTALTRRSEVLQAVHEIQAVTGPATAVLVQRQVSGPELAVGIVRHADFGPLVMVASGGTGLDLWGDQTFLMPPLTADDVQSALRSLRTWPLLIGFRGSKPLDVQAVVDLVLAVGRLAVERPDLIELDLNPVIVTDDGPLCVDVKIRAGS